MIIKPHLPKRSLKDYHLLIKDKCCRWCKPSKIIQLELSPIINYNHAGGYEVKGYKEKQWLYVECPRCGYQFSLVKLGVER